MQTRNGALLDVLGQEGARFVIPAYQRAYAWKTRECEELWLDVFRAAKAGSSHFTGTLLYSVEENRGAGEGCGSEEAGVRLAVVDGQQRLTTVTLILLALVRRLRSTGESLAGLSAADIETRYLRVAPPKSKAAAAEPANPADLSDPANSANLANPAEPPVAPGKLVLSRGDRATLLALVEGGPLPEKPSANLLANLAFFEGLMSEDGFNAEELWRGLNLLLVIVAQVEQDDPAQLIFESLNSKGLPLTTADLVRNYLLIAESRAEQARLYDEYWRPIEGMFQPDPGSLRLDNAIQGWLSVRFRKVRAKGAGQVYSVFKRYVEDEYTGTTENLLRELRNFSLVWAENYRYHAVKKYKSASAWAVNGAGTLTAGYEKKPASNKAYAESVRAELDALDESL